MHKMQQSVPYVANGGCPCAYH